MRWKKPNSGSSALPYVPPLDVALRAFFTDPAMSRGRALARLKAWVMSDEYLCPGGHYSRVLTYDEKEQIHGHTCWTEDGVVYRSRPLPLGVTYVLHGACEETIVIDLEWEADDMGGSRYSYPVAEGPCVEALGYDEEPLYDSPLMGQFVERRRIRKLLNGGWLGRLEDLPSLREAPSGDLLVVDPERSPTSF